jgi:ammonium transporter, Amt family
MTTEIDKLFTLLFTASGSLIAFLVIVGLTMVQVGFIRSKNTVSILTVNFAAFCISTICFLIIGYNLAYSDDILKFFSYFELLWHGTSPLGMAISGKSGAEKMLLVFFYLIVSSMILPIIAGATAERVKLWAFLLVGLIIQSIIFPIQASWNTPGGFLYEFGFIDIGGAAKVHLFAGTVAFAGVLVIGARQGRFNKNGRNLPYPGANIPLLALGAFLLWLGLMAINIISQLQTGHYSPFITVSWLFITCTLVANTGLFVALTLSRILYGKADLTLMINGAIAGLVMLSAAPMITITGSIMIGLLAGFLVVFSNHLCLKLRFDDPCGFVTVHGLAGFIGCILAAISQQKALLDVVKFADADLFPQLWIQISGGLIIMIFTFFCSLLTWWSIRALLGLRIKSTVESRGLDTLDCGISAYPEFMRNHKQNLTR